MKSQSRERFSIDLQGLKSALMARSQALGVSPSDLIRRALVQELDAPVAPVLNAPPKRSGNRSRLCLRMGREDVVAILDAAKRADMGPGAFVAGLVAGVPLLVNGGAQSDHIASLIESNDCVANLSRNIYALTRLLMQANVPQARVNRDMLDTLNKDIRAHLLLSSQALFDLRPCRSSHRVG